MTNQLQLEGSTYLRDHAHQPVNWMTWSPDALQKAQSENKPLLVSIGYSACHWCQTMSRVNFEDSYVASLMNRHFVNILVDREERPDLDQIYMEAVQMFNQSAGWPLHVFCLPTGEPFWGGTFFPKEDIGQDIAPWPQVLIRISEHFRKHPEELRENAENVMKNLVHSNNAECSSPEAWTNDFLTNAASKLCELHDPEHGGFTHAPKFPAAMKIDFLLGTLESEHARKRPEVYSKVKNCILKTLNGMAIGGIFDHLDGGFFRYCIDEKWSIPHFEKMLLENSLMVSTYSRAFRKFQSPLFSNVVKKTLAWLFRDMGNEFSGFASSVSAESEGSEGKYYLWQKEELLEGLGEAQASILTKELTGITDGDSTFFLPRLGYKEEQNELIEKSIFPKLVKLRLSREPPEKDEKRVVSLNAPMIGALVEASIALDDMDLLDKACSLADWMKEKFPINEKMPTILYPDQSETENLNPPFLDDLVFWAENLLILSSKSEIVRPKSSTGFLKDAIKLINLATEFHRDEQIAGYFFSSSKSRNPPPLRKKMWHDNSSPSANSSLLRVFAMLFVFTDDKKWKDEYLEARSAYPMIAQKNPESIAYAMSSILEATMGIAKVKIPTSKMQGLWNALISKPHRPIIVTTNSDPTCKLVVGDSHFSENQPEDLMKILFD